MRSLATIAVVLVLASRAVAGGPCSGVRGGCGRSSYRASDSLPSYAPSSANSSTSACGAVHVRAHTRKNGIRVSAHNRQSQGCDGETPKRSYRTSARTSARTSYWKGTGSEPDDQSLYAPVPAASNAMPQPPPKLPARYVVHFRSGKTRQIANYDDHGDTFSIDGTTGGHTTYPTWMIERIEPITGAEVTTVDRPRYIAHFTDGETRALADYRDANEFWILVDLNGGRGEFRKSMIKYFEPTHDAIGVMRKWTDLSGSHHATAKFIGIEGQKVVLTNDDDKTIRIPIDKLSHADRDLVNRLHELLPKP